MSELAVLYGLTGQQQSYVTAYLSNGYNKKQAMESTGASYGLVNDPKVQQAIRSESKAAFEEARFSVIGVIQYLQGVLSATVDDYYKLVDGRLIVRSDISREKMSYVAHIKTDKDGIIDIKLHDKKWAQDALSKMLAWYQPEQIDHNMNINAVIEEKKSPEELRRALALQLQLAIKKLKEKPKVTEAEIIEE